MNRIVVALVTALAASGCATTQVFDREQAKGLEGQTLVVARHGKPGFTAMTAGKAMFGALGAAAMVNAGNELVAQHKIADPAPVVHGALAAALVDSFGLVLVPAEVDMESPVARASISKKARYALDVETTGWGFAYFPANWTHYWVQYGAKAKLIDTSSGTVLAQGSCARPSPASADGAPTRDELLANDAARLRAELEAAANYCVRVLRSTMFRPGTLKPLPAVPTTTATAPAPAPAAATPAPAAPEAAPVPASAPAP